MVATSIIVLMFTVLWNTTFAGYSGCKFNALNDHNKVLNLTGVQGMDLTWNYYTLLYANYSVCSNNASCIRGNYNQMAYIYVNDSNPIFGGCCDLAVWDDNGYNDNPTYYNGVWSFYYNHPSSHCWDCSKGNYLRINWVCDELMQTAKIDNVTNSDYNCGYTIWISSKYACIKN